jgi:hypothetical protein
VARRLFALALGAGAVAAVLAARRRSGAGDGSRNGASQHRAERLRREVELAREQLRADVERARDEQ